MNPVLRGASTDDTILPVGFVPYVHMAKARQIGIGRSCPVYSSRCCMLGERRACSGGAGRMARVRVRRPATAPAAVVCMLLFSYFRHVCYVPYSGALYKSHIPLGAVSNSERDHSELLQVTTLHALARGSFLALFSL